MNVGTRPESGDSRMTIEMYRVGPDGRRKGPVVRRVFCGVPGPLMLVSDRWPPCRCLRCLSDVGAQPDVRGFAVREA
ncbi:hypothetical protein AB0O01_06985 [Streptomyces sp. NPDC093252]|uniref:hypothetical protein n=1 Tax=Streptomyces sp. NPDC093252 TaxID=3154980 RepID=UPI00343842D7